MTQHNYVDATGLVTEDLAAITARLQSGFQGIYGTDINLDSNSPDGQMVGLLAQEKVDMLGVVRQVYNSFSPNNATGNVLDQRVGINGIERVGATYTQISVNFAAPNPPVAVSLVGLPNSSPFTIADSAGNQYYLMASQTIPPGGATAVQFQASTIGATLVQAGALTIITGTPGLTTISYNATPIAQQGVDAEGDIALRARRQNAVSIPAQGWLPAMQGALQAVDGVTGAKVWENNTASTDDNGIPAHGIWCVVAGGAQSAIGTVIYNKRNGGASMKGSILVPITQVNGTTFYIAYDKQNEYPLYFNVQLTHIDGSTIDATYLKKQILAQFGGTYGIGQLADFTDVIYFIKSIDPAAVIGDGSGLNASAALAVSDPRQAMAPTKLSGMVADPKQGMWTLTSVLQIYIG